MTKSCGVTFATSRIFSTKNGFTMAMICFMGERDLAPGEWAVLALLWWNDARLKSLPPAPAADRLAS